MTNQPNLEALRSQVFEALGAASTCWDNLEGAGVFQSERAVKIGDELMDAILAALSPTVEGEVENKWRKAAEVVLAEVKVNGVPALEFIDKVVNQ